MICVNYNSESETREFVKAFSTLEGANRMLIAVVDNSDSEKLVQALHGLDCADGTVKVLKPGTNLGYFGGAAWGFARLLEEEKLPEWVAVSNTDIHPVDGSFLEKLRSLSAHSSAAIIAPAIAALPSGAPQNPYMLKRPSYMRMKMSAIIYNNHIFFYLHLSLSLIKRGIKTWFRNAREETRPLESCALYAPHGSFVIFHRSYFEKGGNLDFGAFLFGEEIFVAETAHRLKLKVEFEPTLSYTSGARDHRVTQ